MTPRSRKPVMLTMFGNSEKSYQTNISQLLEESENEEVEFAVPAPSVPLSSLIPQSSEAIANTSLNAANDNGLPTVAETGSSSSSGSLSSAFK